MRENDMMNRKPNPNPGKKDHRMLPKEKKVKNPFPEN